MRQKITRTVSLAQVFSQPVSTENVYILLSLIDILPFLVVEQNHESFTPNMLK